MNPIRGLNLLIVLSLCLVILSPAHTQEQQEISDEVHAYWTIHDKQFWVNVLISMVCTVTGAFCSGMTVGLLSINKMQLQLMIEKSDSKERQMAVRINNLVSDHHLFLVTLLIANAIALQSLPIILHSLMPDWAAVLFSTFVVLVVAEIVPQAYCTGPYKLILAYYAAPIISVMIKLFYVLAFPIAKGLDKLMGVHEHQRIQHKDFAAFLNQNKALEETEKMLLNDTLELRSERVHQIMVPIDTAFMIEINQTITEEVIRQIANKDYSYVLVYRELKKNVVGMVKVKELALKHLEKDKLDLSSLIHPKIDLLTVYADTNLLQMLMLFQTRGTQLALVCKDKKKIDPNVPSVYYSKKDMIYYQNQAEITGFIFLNQIFNEVAKYEHKNQQKQEINNVVEEGGFKKKKYIQMTAYDSSLDEKLINKQFKI